MYKPKFLEWITSGGNPVRKLERIFSGPWIKSRLLRKAVQRGSTLHEQLLQADETIKFWLAENQDKLDYIELLELRLRAQESRNDDLQRQYENGLKYVEERRQQQERSLAGMLQSVCDNPRELEGGICIGGPNHGKAINTHNHNFQMASMYGSQFAVHSYLQDDTYDPYIDRQCEIHNYKAERICWESSYYNRNTQRNETERKEIRIFLHQSIDPHDLGAAFKMLGW